MSTQGGFCDDSRTRSSKLLRHLILKYRRQNKLSTELEVFVDKTVCGFAHADGEGKHVRRRNKKARDFTHPFIHKSTLLSTVETAFKVTAYKVKSVIKSLLKSPNMPFKSKLRLFIT